MTPRTPTSISVAISTTCPSRATISRSKTCRSNDHLDHKRQRLVQGQLEDTDDGVLVTFMGRRRCDGAELWRQISLTTLDVVFHVAADAVFVLLNTMTPEFRQHDTGR